MTPASQDIAAVIRALASADESRLLAVVAMVDRLADRAALDAVIDHFRPRLAELRPPRPLTLKRVLTYPLEPALVPTNRWAPGSYRIPRHHLPELHRAVFAALPEGRMEELQSRLAGATSQDMVMVLETGRRLWPEAAAVLAQRAEQRHVADTPLRISCRLSSHLLALGEAVMTAVWRLPPRPIIELDPDAQTAVDTLLAEAAVRGREALMLVLELLVELSESPLTIAGRALAPGLALPARERAQCVAVTIDNALARLSHALAESGPAVARPAAVAELVLRVVNITDSLAEAPREVPFDRYAVRKLLAATAALAEQTLLVTLEGPLLASFASDGEDSERQLPPKEREDMARALARIRLAARQLGLVSKVQYRFRQAERSFLDAFTRFVEQRRLRQGKLLPLDLEVMDRIRILEILFGSHRATEIWRSYRERARAEAENPSAAAAPMDQASRAFSTGAIWTRNPPAAPASTLRRAAF